jgi:hypothetical protein
MRLLFRHDSHLQIQKSRLLSLSTNSNLEVTIILELVCVLTDSIQLLFQLGLVSAIRSVEVPVRKFACLVHRRRGRSTYGEDCSRTVSSLLHSWSSLFLQYVRRVPISLFCRRRRHDEQKSRSSNNVLDLSL